MFRNGGGLHSHPAIRLLHSGPWIERLPEISSRGRLVWRIFWRDDMEPGYSSIRFGGEWFLPKDPIRLAAQGSGIFECRVILPFKAANGQHDGQPNSTQGSIKEMVVGLIRGVFAIIVIALVVYYIVQGGLSEDPEINDANSSESARNAVAPPPENKPAASRVWDSVTRSSQRTAVAKLPSMQSDQIDFNPSERDVEWLEAPSIDASGRLEFKVRVLDVSVPLYRNGADDGEGLSVNVAEAQGGALKGSIVPPASPGSYWPKKDGLFEADIFYFDFKSRTLRVIVQTSPDFADAADSLDVNLWTNPPQAQSEKAEWINSHVIERVD